MENLPQEYTIVNINLNLNTQHNLFWNTIVILYDISYFMWRTVQAMSIITQQNYTTLLLVNTYRTYSSYNPPTYFGAQSRVDTWYR